MKQGAIGAAVAALCLTSASMAAVEAPDSEQVIVTPDTAKLLPAADRPWGPDDYEAAYLVLSHLPAEKLPDSNTPVFLRMINPQNLDLARDINGPMPQRLLLTQRYLLATARITACYLPDMKTNPTHHEDVSGLESLFVHELGLLMLEMHEIQSVPNPSMESSALLDPKVEKIKNGLDQIIGDMLTSLKAPRSETAKWRIAQALRDEYPNLAPYLSQKTRADAQAILAALPG